MEFSLAAGLMLGGISLPGLLINIYVFLKLSTQHRPFSGFHKLCAVKSVPNMIVCFTFLVWTTPLCVFHPKYIEVNRRVNVGFGQVAGWGCYILAPLILVCMSFNRFYSLFFPFKVIKLKKFPITNLSIIISLAIALLYTLIGLPDGCGFVFDPELLSWRPEVFPCAQFLSFFIFYSVISLTVVSNFLNFMTFLKLLFRQVGGLTVGESTIRRKRKVNMYIQSVLQDTLHLIDMMNCTIIFRLNSSIWFQFACLSLSFLLIHALDGCVMLYFHTEIHPKWWLSRRKMKSKGGTVISVMNATIHFSA